MKHKKGHIENGNIHTHFEDKCVTITVLFVELKRVLIWVDSGAMKCGTAFF